VIPLGRGEVPWFGDFMAFFLEQSLQVPVPILNEVVQPCRDDIQKKKAQRPVVLFFR
jgi:hypothetical protein